MKGRGLTPKTNANNSSSAGTLFRIGQKSLSVYLFFLHPKSVDAAQRSESCGERIPDNADVVADTCDRSVAVTLRGSDQCSDCETEAWRLMSALQTLGDSLHVFAK